MEVHSQHWSAYTDAAIGKVHVRISSIINQCDSNGFIAFISKTTEIASSVLFDNNYNNISIYLYYMCRHPEAPCTYLTDNFSSRCSQIYNYHRLLSWDNKRGLHIDIFKVRIIQYNYCNCMARLIRSIVFSHEIRFQHAVPVKSMVTAKNSHPSVGM